MARRKTKEQQQPQKPLRACVGVFANNGRRDKYCRTCPKCLLHLQALEGAGYPMYDSPALCEYKDKISYDVRHAPNMKSKRTLNSNYFRHD